MIINKSNSRIVVNKNYYCLELVHNNNLTISSTKVERSQWSEICDMQTVEGRN